MYAANGARTSGPAGGRPGLLVAACCLSVFVSGVSTTALNTALPVIKVDLGMSLQGLQWTVDAYSLVIACLLLLAGSLADRYGRRLVFIAGLVLFTLASAGCGLASSAGWLITMRVVQAVGGAMLNPVALSIITNALTRPEDRARAIGTWGAVFGLSIGLGPVIGGTLVSALGWRSVFFVNIPLTLVALWLTLRHISESRAARPRRLDPAGQVSFALALAGLTYAVIDETSTVAAITLGVFVLAAVSFVAIELRSQQPLLDLRFFRSPPLAGASLIAILAFGVLAGFSFLSSLYLQQARSLTPIQAGLALLPMAGFMAVVGIVSGRLVARHGPRVPLVVSGLTIAAGCAMLLGLTKDTPMGYLLTAFAVLGIGLGMVNPPISTTAVSSMPADQSGVAASLASVSRQIGGVLGVAVVGVFVAASTPADFAQDSRAAWLVLACCGVAVAVLGLVSTGDWARAATDRNARKITT